MADPYQVLGVSREATPEAIRKAYRKLAKASHPDLHPGDKAAEDRFKSIATAHGIVGDEKRRALFDSGKIDATGAELHEQPRYESYRQHAEAHPGFKYERQWNGAELDEEDILASLFGRHSRARTRGGDINYTITVDFIDAVMGAKRQVAMADGRALNVTIPAGLKDGQVLRLRGLGRPGGGGEEPGDVLVDVHVSPHSVFTRDGGNIRSILPVTLAEALAGARLPVATVSGTVNLAIPKGSNTGTLLRLRGKGVPSKAGNGDHIVELKVVLPTSADDEFVRTVAEWEAKHPYDPRKEVAGQP